MGEFSDFSKHNAVLPDVMPIWTCNTSRFLQQLILGLHRISAPAPANAESGHFSEIQPSPATAKFLAGFTGFDRR